MIRVPDRNRAILLIKVAVVSGASEVTSRHRKTNVPIQAAFVAKGDQIRDVKAPTDREVTGYAFASLANVGPVPMALPVPPTVDVYDSSNRLNVGDFRMAAQDGFTKMRGWVSLKQTGNYRYDATLNFYDAAGKALGTAELKQTSSGSAESFTVTTFETACDSQPLPIRTAQQCQETPECACHVLR
jgi:hypothetical protein